MGGTWSGATTLRVGGGRPTVARDQNPGGTWPGVSGRDDDPNILTTSSRMPEFFGTAVFAHCTQTRDFLSGFVLHRGPPQLAFPSTVAGGNLDCHFSYFLRKVDDLALAVCQLKNLKITELARVIREQKAVRIAVFPCLNCVTTFEVSEQHKPEANGRHPNKHSALLCHGQS